MMRFLFLLFCFSVSSQELAFYGAEGFGKYTAGGKGGTVYHVTSLANSGGGTLREYAQNTSGARTIVFDISGEIDLSSYITINDPYITIAGETAPEGGITIKGAGIQVRASEVVIRHIRIRPGATSPADTDALRINNAVNSGTPEVYNNMIFDHLSLSFARDENFSIACSLTARDFGSEITNLTFQKILSSAPVDSRYGAIVGPASQYLTFYRNYHAHEYDRHPLLGYGNENEKVELINNVIYDYEHPINITYGIYVDAISNVAKLKSGSMPLFNMFRYVSSANNPDGVAEDGRVHGSGNYSNNTEAVDEPYNSTFDTHNEVSRILTTSNITTWLTDETEIVDAVLGDVGANIYEDTLDAQMIADYAAGTGSYAPNGATTESYWGGYPTIASNTRAGGFYSVSAPDISASFYAEHGLSGNGTNITTYWDFNGETFHNTEGLSDFEMYLGYLAGDLVDFVSDTDIPAIAKRKTGQAMLMN